MNKYGIRYSGVCCTHYTDFSCCCDLLEFCAFGALDFGNFRRRKSQHLFFGRHAAASRTADKIIRPLIKAQKAGMNVNANQLESHLLSGGRVDNVVDALIAAHRANLDLSFERQLPLTWRGETYLKRCA